MTVSTRARHYFDELRLSTAGSASSVGSARVLVVLVVRVVLAVLVASVGPVLLGSTSSTNSTGRYQNTVQGDIKPRLVLAVLAVRLVLVLLVLRTLLGLALSVSLANAGLSPPSAPRLGGRSGEGWFVAIPRPGQGCITICAHKNRPCAHRCPALRG